MNTSSTNLTYLRTEIAPLWVEEPNGRGTWSLLYSCTFTIVLCVSTAVHLNIPGPGESRTRSRLRKLKWVCIALFAPEIVLYTAAYQYSHAWLLHKELNGLWFEKHPPPPPTGKTCQIQFSRRFIVDHEEQSSTELGEDCTSSKSKPGGLVRSIARVFRSKPYFYERCATWFRSKKKREKFDMQYCFCVVMGGLTVDVSSIHNTYTKLVLTPVGIKVLAQQSRFFEVDSDTIKDKSKADTLAKGLIVFQVFWSASSTIARKVAGLPLSLLEVHTMVHVACAILMYAFWWHKPKDMSTPLDQDFKSDDILAYILLTTRLPSTVVSVDPEDGQAPQMFLWESGSLNHRLDQSGPGHNLINAINIERPRFKGNDVVTAAKDIRPQLSLLAGNKRSNSNEFFLSERDVKRWSSAGHFMNSFSSDGGLSKQPMSEDGSWRDLLGHYTKTRLVSERQLNFSINFDYASSYSPRIFRRLWRNKFEFLLSLLASAYAAVHLATQSIHFATILEASLWKCACFVLFGSAISIGFRARISRRLNKIMWQICRNHWRLAGGANNPWELRGNNRAAFVSKFIAGLADSIEIKYWLRSTQEINFSYWQNSTHKKPFRLYRNWRTAVICPFLLLYVLARGFLVVESFISLRQVPVGVYASLDWISYIPHL